MQDDEPEGERQAVTKVAAQRTMRLKERDKL